MDANKILEEIDNYLKQFPSITNSKYKVDGIQYIGTRDIQEDTIVYFKTEQNVFACLADGIGGLEHGEIASALACKTILNKCLKNTMKEKLFLVNSFYEANQAVVDFVEENALSGSGCTLIGIWISSNRLSFCSIGDSLLYLYRDEKLIQLNRRHNYKLYLDNLLYLKKINNTDYQVNLSKKDVVISYIGKGEIDLIDFNKEGMLLKKGDVILMCSDGVLSAINEQEIEKIIGRNQNPATINSSIINLVRMKRNTKQDNTSIVTIYIEGDQE